MRVRRIRANGSATSTYDGEDQERVKERVEGVDADCVLGFEAGVFEASN